jgi:rod shape-determining protein MreC
MYQNKHIDAKYVILLILVIIAILLGVITSAVKDNRKLNPIEQAIKDSALFVNKIVYQPIKWIGSIVNDIKEKQNIYEKYKELLKQQDSINLVSAKNIELQDEIKNLQELLELNRTLTKDSYLNASVINRNIGYWYNTITIDKGSSNGVAIDMAVITNDGLIGKVIKTTNFNSVVKLLTSNDINNKISVKIQNGDEFVYGLLSGYDIKKNTFIIEGISEQTEILPNGLVITTGLGDLFPSGILIGHVESISNDSFDLSKIVHVKSNANFNDLKYVTILKRDDSK